MCHIIVLKTVQQKFHPFFPLSPQPRPPASSWKKLEESREYTNGNTLREYQLEGVNWLLFNWYNRYLSHTGAYYTPWSPVAKCILKPQSNWIDFTGLSSSSDFRIRIVVELKVKGTPWRVSSIFWKKSIWNDACFSQGFTNYCLFLVSQAELYPGRWDGSGEDHPVHRAAVGGLRCWHSRPFLGYCSPLHHHQLGEGVHHMDPHERHRLPWQPGQPTDDPAVWDVLQGWQGGVIYHDCCWLTLVMVNVSNKNGHSVYRSTWSQVHTSLMPSSQPLRWCYLTARSWGRSPGVVWSLMRLTASRIATASCWTAWRCWMWWVDHSSVWTKPVVKCTKNNRMSAGPRVLWWNVALKKHMQFEMD